VELDPKIRAYLDSPVGQFPPVEQFTPEAVRELLAQYPAPVLAPPIHAVRDLKVRGAAEGQLLVRLYTPTAARHLPLIVFFHGGGFVICNVGMYDDLCKLLANYSGCAVASVEYRLAPEAPFPAALEDCYAALKALAAQGEALGIDATRIAVAGDSAGGNLAAATALLARDRNGPALRYQGLIYPCVDPECGSESARSLATGYLLTRNSMLWFWGHYLKSPEDKGNPLASPLKANLAGLPPATVVTAEFDPLRDEGEAYADRLRAAGVAVSARRYLGMIHGFASMPYVTPVAMAVLADLGADLRTTLSA
jgi:acetyl esterase